MIGKKSTTYKFFYSKDFQILFDLTLQYKNNTEKLYYIFGSK